MLYKTLYAVCELSKQFLLSLLLPWPHSHAVLGLVSYFKLALLRMRELKKGKEEEAEPDIEELRTPA